MPLAIVGVVEVDPEVANDERACDREAEEKHRELYYLDHGHCLADLVHRVEDFEQDEGQRR